MKHTHKNEAKTRTFLNAPAVSFFRISRGILFHSLAPLTFKARPPSVSVL